MPPDKPGQARAKVCSECGAPKGKKSPESRFFDELKGERVRVVLQRDGSDLTATLLWVDRYSLGLDIPDVGERMYFKHAIQDLGKA